MTCKINSLIVWGTNGRPYYRKVVHHNGECEGFLAIIHRYVNDDFAVVVLSNYGFTAVNKLCKVIASIVFEEDYEIAEKPEVFPLKDDLLESYLGVYEEGGTKPELKGTKEVTTATKNI